MQKFILCTLVFFLIEVVPVVSQDHEDIIEWSADRPLTWDDFQGRVDKRSSFDALSSATFGYNYEYLSGQRLIFVITVGFEISRSWVKRENATEDLLKHEQGHFNINEIFARLCIKELLKVKVKDLDKFGKEVQRIYARIGKDMSKFQDEYDRETNHSKVKDKQREWNEKIDALLRDTEKYGSKEIRLEF